MAVDRVVVDVARRQAGEHGGPHCRVVALILLTILGLQPDDGRHTLHDETPAAAASGISSGMPSRSADA